VRPVGQPESSAAEAVGHAATTPFAAGVEQSSAVAAVAAAAGLAVVAVGPGAVGAVEVGMSVVTAGQVAAEAVHSAGLWLAEVSIAELAANPAATAVAGAGAAVQLGSVVGLTEDAVAAELGSARSDSAFSMLVASDLGGRAVQVDRLVLGCFAVSSRAAWPDDAGLAAAVAAELVPVPVVAGLAVAVAAAAVGLAAAASWLGVDFAGLVVVAVAPAIAVERGGLAAAQGSSAAAGCFEMLADFAVAASSTLATAVGSSAAFAGEGFPLPVPAGSSSGA